ncbi:MAG: ammonium transporter, partial [Dehalococcoidia bacterium]
MPPEIDTGDTTWILISAALVMLMTPGVGFFYGGLVRNKNASATIMQSFSILAVVSVVWVLWGYSLAFGPNELGGFIGNLSWFGLRNVGLEPGPYSDTIPHQAFMVFQLMFAVITPALIIGAFAERAKFRTLIVFTVIWITIVYAPVAHWVWGQGGWLQDLWGGASLDFAGGSVVHINAGVAALVAAFIFGKRLGYGKEPMEPHNVSMVVLGAVLLWFGWFGFNAGSALGANGIAANAFVVTHVASATAALTWVGLSWYFQKKPSIVGAATGAVAGLVAITPAAGFIGSWPVADGYLDAFPAILIGLGAGLFTYLAVQVRIKMRLDDSLDVWGVHGMGGTWGAFATGIFAVASVGGASGLIDGNAGQLARQLTGIGAVWGYSFVLTLVILKVLDVVMGLRVSEEEERLGLDASQHGERGYVLEEAGPLA